jgi:hypothetical protein
MEPAKVTVPPISAPLLRLTREAVGRALNAREGDEPFSPFSIWGSNNSPGNMMAYATITMDEVIATARLVFVQLAPDYYVFAHDAFLTEPEAGINRTEIVSIEAYEKGMDHGLQLAQRFVVGGDHSKSQVIGNLRYLGTVPLPTLEEYGPIVARYEAERKRGDDPGIIER